MWSLLWIAPSATNWFAILITKNVIVNKIKNKNKQS
jgi:hypothetical protein